ncbi:MAG: DUF1669 domain-containing protein [Chitinophagales bacterium]|nr:DUF1669 domain-containing protein [Chitinophagales bacterium]
MIKAHFQNIRIELIKEISSAEKSLKIAVAWFTNNELFDTLLQKCKDKVHVELILINDAINIKQFGLNFNEFIKEGGVLYFGDSENLMHHKFCIIDDKVLINGSYNWTYWAETKNEENITIFKGEVEILKSFNEEFRKIVSTKRQIQSIETNMLNNVSDENSFFNLKNIGVNEYISSAVDLGNRGNYEMANKIFEEVTKLNPVKANRVLQNGVTSNIQVFKNIYQSISTKTYIPSTDTTYEGYCNSIRNLIREGNYINAIGLANTCATKYREKFTVHVYCGDAKTKLNDLTGAEIEYNKALNYRHYPKAKILYYNKAYNYTFFPRADVFLKLGQKDKVIETLNEAVHAYKKLNIPIGVTKAEKYLNDISNNQIPSQIE